MAQGHFGSEWFALGDENHKNSSLETLIEAIGKEFPFTQRSTDLEALAKAQLKTALELQMTEEVAFFFQTLSRQAPLFLEDLRSGRKDQIVWFCAVLGTSEVECGTKV